MRRDKAVEAIDEIVEKHGVVKTLLMIATSWPVFSRSSLYQATQGNFHPNNTQKKYSEVIDLLEEMADHLDKKGVL